MKSLAVSLFAKEVSQILALTTVKSPCVYCKLMVMMSSRANTACDMSARSAKPLHLTDSLGSLKAHSFECHRRRKAWHNPVRRSERFK